MSLLAKCPLDDSKMLIDAIKVNSNVFGQYIVLVLPKRFFEL